MSAGAAAGCRDKEAGAYRYQRHQPENNLLYRILEHHYPDFAAYLAEQGAVLTRCIQREFEAYLNAGTWNMTSWTIWGQYTYFLELLISREQRVLFLPRVPQNFQNLPNESWH